MAKSIGQQPDKRQTFVDKCIKNRAGQVEVWQSPNLPITTWAVARVLVWLLHGTPRHYMQVIAFGTLFTWGWLELFQGVNYVRRALGLAVLVLMIVSAASARSLSG